MTLRPPPGARFDARVAGGVALYDVSHLMPKGSHRRATRRPTPGRIEVLFAHHSGALGAPGFAGMLAAGRFVVDHRGFPGFPYGFWAPRDPVRDQEGRRVLFRGAPDERRTWSQGARANDLGASFSLQGNTSRLPISPNQIELLEAFIPWAFEHYGWPWEEIGDRLSMHSEAHRYGGRRKAACPGRTAEAWLRAYRERALAPHPSVV